MFPPVPPLQTLSFRDLSCEPSRSKWAGLLRLVEPRQTFSATTHSTTETTNEAMTKTDIGIDVRSHQPCMNGTFVVSQWKTQAPTIGPTNSPQPLRKSRTHSSSLSARRRCRDGRKRYRAGETRRVRDALHSVCSSLCVGRDPAAVSLADQRRLAALLAPTWHKEVGWGT